MFSFLFVCLFVFLASCYPLRPLRYLFLAEPRTKCWNFPSHLWRTGLDNVPRAEFPQSVLNSTHRQGPAPGAARPANGEEEGRRGARTVKRAQLHRVFVQFRLINTADVSVTQRGSNVESNLTLIERWHVRSLNKGEREMNTRKHQFMFFSFDISEIKLKSFELLSWTRLALKSMTRVNATSLLVTTCCWLRPNWPHTPFCDIRCFYRSYFLMWVWKMCSVGKNDSLNKGLHACIMIWLSFSTELSSCFGCLDYASVAL